VPDAPPPTDLAAILAELDRRLRELEEELAAVGAPRPATVPEPEAAVPPPPTAAAPAGEPPPAAEPASPSAPFEDPDAALASIRAAVPNRVEVVARAPDALVLRVELDAQDEDDGR